jgi:hypothetical protein
MVDQWRRAGGSLWLDAMLYDAREPEPDVLLDSEQEPGFNQSEAEVSQSL